MSFKERLTVFKKIASIKYSIFYTTFVGFLFLDPFIKDYHLLRLLILLMLMLSLLLVIHSNKWLTAFFLLLIFSVSVFEFFGYRYLLTIGYSVFLGFTIFVLSRNIMEERVITKDLIKGGSSIYYLLGLLWTFFYEFTLIQDPHAITMGGKPFDFSHLLYFSFATLTTLGYGDIVPTSPLAMRLAVLEATIGPLFLSVFIARLMGKHIGSAKKD